LDIDITNAISKAIVEGGFSNVKLRDIMEHGKVSLPVLNSRYESVEDMIDQYVRRYDYWLNNTVDINPNNIVEPKEYYIEAAEKLINSFYTNKEIQQLHIWEMSEENPTTMRTANIREKETARLVNFFEDKFRDSDIDIAAITAVIVGGIYDVILRKERSTFCGVDFSKREGKRRLISAVETLVTLLYDKKDHNEDMLGVAERLLHSGVSIEVISQSTGVPIETIEELRPPPSYF
jgi:AcrR family transcriptional regulator